DPSERASEGRPGSEGQAYRLRRARQGPTQHEDGRPGDRDGNRAGEEGKEKARRGLILRGPRPQGGGYIYWHVTKHGSHFSAPPARFGAASAGLSSAVRRARP